jgi:FkbM family methyltransferase
MKIFLRLFYKVLNFIKFFNLHIKDSAIQRRVFNKHFYDLHIKEFMLGQTKQFLTKDSIVLDIGAAAGIYSTYWASLVKEVHAFEPIPITFRQTIKLEKKFDNVKTYNLAISSKNEFRKMYVDINRLSNNSFTKQVEGSDFFVETRTIDSFNFKTINFIKIDVEGFEREVINGAIQAIKSFKPILMIEIYPKFATYNIKNLFDLFFNLDYQVFYNIRGEGLKQIKNANDGERIARSVKKGLLHDFDFLFLPKGTKWQ